MTALPPRRRSRTERRRETIDRIDAMTVKSTDATGRLLIVGTGEATLDVAFPVAFSELPIFTFGGELEDGQNVVFGQFPTISAIVAEWVIVGQIEGAFTGRYTGARLAAFTTGPDDLQLWLHYRFTGKAMRNPINSVTDVTDTNEVI